MLMLINEERKNGRTYMFVESRRDQVPESRKCISRYKIAPAPRLPIKRKHSMVHVLYKAKENPEKRKLLSGTQIAPQNHHVL